MKWLLSFTCTLFLFLQSAKAQQIISTAGESVKIDGFEISWTLGEPLISTLSGNSCILTQGFQQPNLKVTNNKVNPFTAQNIKVYPNPVDESIVIQQENVPKYKLTFFIYNTEGKQLQKGEFVKNPQRIDMRRYASGCYFLVVSFENSRQNDVFKLVKK